MELVTDFGINILWHPSIGLELGDQASTLLMIFEGQDTNGILVYEGSIVQGPIKGVTMNYFAERPMQDGM